MEFDKTLTPEKQWDKVKKLMFKDEAPKNIEDIMQKGFKESYSESEKWNKLITFMEMVKKKYEKSIR